MKILNFGSLNIDHVYHVRNFVRPGETISAKKYSRFCGGKGLNQSIAIARSGATVIHAGKIGEDGLFLRDKLSEAGVDCSCLEISQEPTGHAVIQVSDQGENCIVLFGGCNQAITPKQIKSTLKKMEKGDFLLLQNEISRLPEIITAAHEKGLRIFFNPAPINADVFSCPLDLIDTFIVNETEAAGLSGLSPETTPAKMIDVLRIQYPHANILMTLGAAGAIYGTSEGKTIPVPAEHVEKVVDTTAAGDTFIGYFLSETALGKTPEEAMKTAAKASAFCVARPGAADSIPFRKEL